ncbi:MAG TPA: outer membrane beta-barrel protein [Xanthobacteraceae bacterium]|nr:outer membrane beta-barrel protein [Xanthobacteraceae bacterium]
MKRIVIAAALALAAGGQALAADLPQPAPPPPPRAPATYVPTVVPTYNWGGVYIGINGGYGFGDSDWTNSAASTSTGSFSTDGFLIGGTLGANFQMNAFVFGAEVDGDWQDLKGNSGAACGTLGAGAAFTCETKSEWIATARVRGGVAMDRVLVFLTGGGAAGNVQAGPSPTAFTGGGATTNSSTEYGWTAGGGVEVAFTQNLTAKIEYLYVDLEHGSCTTACTYPTGSTPPTVTPNFAVSFTESLVRAGVNWKF